MILAILQARMSSSRLPGKVLKPILGRPMIGRHIDRIRRARMIDRLVLATSSEPSDDPLAAFCGAEGIPCHRGSLMDSISRFQGAVRAFGPASHIVRLTGDCPLADWTVIDACIDLHLMEGADFTSNAMRRTFPDGLDVEIMTVAMLDLLDRESSDAKAREEITNFAYRHPEQFRLAHLVQSPDRSLLRWTVDTQADFCMVEAVYRELLPGNPDFLQDDILKLLAARPDIARINARTEPLASA
jgi:spore coat polysaccharide biosynthesis protein SpsF